MKKREKEREKEKEKGEGKRVKRKQKYCRRRCVEKMRRKAVEIRQ